MDCINEKKIISHERLSPTFRIGITQTPSETVVLDTNGRKAKGIVINGDSVIYHEWKMGKAEMRYRLRINDKHARRWIRRNKKKLNCTR